MSWLELHLRDHDNVPILVDASRVVAVTHMPTANNALVTWECLATPETAKESGAGQIMEVVAVRESYEQVRTMLTYGFTMGILSIEQRPKGKWRVAIDAMQYPEMRLQDTPT